MSASRHLNDLRDSMTLKEKSMLMSGANFWNTQSIDRLGVPAIMLTDGPHGLRKQGGAADHLGLNASLPATCFPTAATLANSWNAELVERVGAALGAEAAAEQVSVVLGPGLNIKRNPLAGRNFEYFSEDPLLSGRLAAALIRGIQSQGVAACPKHFAVNSQEHLRMTINEVVDERALHELYLEGFRIAVTEGQPWTLMTSYNRVNGTYANEHTGLLRDVLRGRWGFDGLVVTDWGGSFDRVAGLEAGNALEMPSTSGVTNAEIVRAVESGRTSETVLDERVDEVLTLLERVGAFDRDQQAASHGTREAVPAASREHSALLNAHHRLAAEAARESVVLLENPHGTLPLAVPSAVGAGGGPGALPAAGAIHGAHAPRIAVIGDFAATPRYQGAGSSLVNPTRLENARDALAASDLNIVGYARGFARRDRRSARKQAAALRLAGRADLVLLFLGLDESAEAEGVDREHMRLAQNQLDLTDALLARGSRVIVVLAGGAPVELPFADRVEAIVHGYLPGQAGGSAIVDVLTGRHNPSGRLAETYPMHYADVPSSESFARTDVTSEHRESIYLGYRYFDKIDAAVRYPFGYGLSYTTFAFERLEAGPGSARVTVINTGERAGAEVVQLYAVAPGRAAGAFRAPQELAGFARVFLEPGESQTVVIHYGPQTFRAYDPAAAGGGSWRTVPGSYEIHAGASSRDVRLRATVEVGEADPPRHNAGNDFMVDRLPAPYLSGRVGDATAEDFAELLGSPVPTVTRSLAAPLTRADTISQAKGRGGFASVMYFLIDASGKVLMALGRPLAANNTRFVLELPFRSVSRMSGGAVDDAMLDGLLTMVNGRFWRGSTEFISAWRRKRAHEKHMRKGR